MKPQNTREDLTRRLVHELLDQLNEDAVAALGLVINELQRAERLWPEWPTDQVYAAAIVAEESGELVQAVLNMKYKGSKDSATRARDEAIQTAATALRFHIHAPVELPNGTLS